MATKKDTSKHAGPTSWAKGKSGNPGGRSPKVGPNGETLTALCRAHTAEAVGVLKDVMLGKLYDPKDRVVAANSILDRGWGKPGEMAMEGAAGKVDMATMFSELIAKLPA